jgi:hypothetical protein
MTESALLSWGFTFAIAIAGWFMKRTLDSNELKIAKLEAEMSAMKSNYLHKDDFREFKTELKSMFEEIRADIRQINHKQQ